MADDTEKLLQEMKDVLASVKEMGQYTRDLSSAMNNMTRPMQQMSDYMKVISQQTAQTQKDSADMFEVQKKMTENLQSSVELVKQRNKLTEDEHNLNVKIKEQHAENLRLKNEKIVKDAADKEKYIAQRDHGMLMNLLAKEQVGIFDQIANKVAVWQKELQAAGKELKDIDGQLKAVNKEGFKALAARTGAFTATKGSHLFTGQADAGAALSGIVSKISSTFLPMMGIGGLLGMMIHGVHRDEEFRAVGAAAAQQFDQIGGHTKQLSSELGLMARTLETFGYGSREDIAAVTSAFASTGINAETASKKIEEFNSVIGSSLIAATLAADKQLELAAGTMAKAAGILQADFNVAAADAVGKLLEIGNAAGKAGMNTAAFMQQTMDAASSVRLLNANFEDFGKMQLQMANAMGRAGFKNANFNQGYAGAGAASVGQAVGGMDEGLAGILGERLRLGDGIDAIYAMKSPLGRKENDRFSTEAVVKQMRDIVTGMSSKRSEQWLALQKVFGLDSAGADMVLQAGDEISSTGALSAGTKKGLERGLSSESEKRNRMDQNIEIIKDAVSSIMVGLLGTIINSLKLVYNGIIWLGAKIASLLPGGNTKENMELLADSEGAIKDNIGSIGKSMSRVGSGFEQAYGASKDSMNLMGLNSRGMVSPSKVMAAMTAKSPEQAEAERIQAEYVKQQQEERAKRERELLGPEGIKFFRKLFMVDNETDSDLGVKITVSKKGAGKDFSDN